MATTSGHARHFKISRRQLEILSRVAGEDRLEAASGGDEPAFLEMWRNGLLRMNGGSGYQVSRLGMAALQAARSFGAQTSR